jgi:acyl-CoA hydrolase
MAKSEDSATLLDSYTEMTEMLLPNDTNTLGRALGGAVLHWMDLAGAISAMRFSGLQCVTAAMDHVDFISPIDEGEVAIVEAYVFDTGRTSVDVKVDVRAEDPREGDPRETTTSFFTFVALDEDGRPAPVPTLETPTENQQALRDAAREQRLDQLRDVMDRMDVEAAEE